MKPCRVRIVSGSASFTIGAEQIGAFAIHRMMLFVTPKLCRQDADRWTVTHIATGLAACHPHNLDAARKAADRLNAMPVHWPSLTAEAIDAWPRHLTQQARDIRELAMSA
jgi:hypothetical protein